MILFLQSELIYAKNYYRTHADDYRTQFAQNSKDRASKELLASYQGYEQLVSNEITAQLLSSNTDTAILYLESSDLLEDKKLLAELYLGKGEISKCRQLLNEIKTQTGLTKSVLLHLADEKQYADENAEFVELIQLAVGIIESGRNISEATAAEIAAIEQLTTTATANAPKACAYLKQATGRECSFDVLPYEPTMEEKQQRMAIPDYESESIELLAYPNPANDYLNITAFIPENFGDASLLVYDIQGKQSAFISLSDKLNQIQLNTSSYSNGIYFLNLRKPPALQVVMF